MVNDEYKFIFVHIRRTGGTSIEKVFAPSADKVSVANKHRPISWYIDKYPAQYHDYFSFAIVRNPFDWLVSRYHWSRFTQKLLDYDFDTFLHRIHERLPLSEDAKWLDAAMDPQLNQLLYRSRLAVDFIGRHERLQRDFDHVCDAIGHEHVKLPRVFRTRHDNYRSYYSDKTRELVREIYFLDLSVFGYDL